MRVGYIYLQDCIFCNFCSFEIKLIVECVLVDAQVMEAVCVLLDVKPTRLKDPSGSGKMIDDFWPSAQKVSAAGAQSIHSWQSFQHTSRTQVGLVG